MPSFTMAVRILAKALSVTCTPLAGAFGAAVSVSASIMICSVRIDARSHTSCESNGRDARSPLELLCRYRYRLRYILLLLPVMNGRTDRVFREHRAVNLHWGQRKFLHDLGVLDLQRFVHGFALHPLGGQGRGRNGRAASERLEFCVFNDVGLWVDLDLQ